MLVKNTKTAVGLCGVVVTLTRYSNVSALPYSASVHDGGGQVSGSQWAQPTGNCSTVLEHYNQTDGCNFLYGRQKCK